MIRFVLALLLFATPALADNILLLGAGGKKPSAAVPSYSGPGDVVSGATFWGSCARVYNLAAASTSTNLCDLVAVTGGAAVCTLRGSSTGFVDLAASYCAGTTPAAACAAASGGSCKVSKIYDQSGNGRDVSQATLANMPNLTFNALGGLPCATFVRASSNELVSSATLTLSQPYTAVAVSKRTGTTTNYQGIITGTSPAYGLMYNASADNALIYAGSLANFAATDSSFHALQGVFNGASSVGVNDGSGTSLNPGTGDFTTGSTFALGAQGSSRLDGVLCEAGVWPSAFNATQYGNMNTNQHSAANGYNF